MKKFFSKGYIKNFVFTNIIFYIIILKDKVIHLLFCFFLIFLAGVGRPKIFPTFLICIY